jgi:hypothetical protein
MGGEGELDCLRGQERGTGTARFNVSYRITAATSVHRRIYASPKTKRLDIDEIMKQF